MSNFDEQEFSKHCIPNVSMAFPLGMILVLVLMLLDIQ
jgi:hypothetical protein